MPLFEIDVVEIAYTTPATAEQDDEPNDTTLMELRRAQDAFDREMEISCRIATIALEEINVGTPDASVALSVAKDLPLRKKLP